MYVQYVRTCVCVCVSTFPTSTYHLLLQYHRITAVYIHVGLVTPVFEYDSYRTRVL